MKKDLSRREFIKGAMAGATGLALSGVLAGCAQSTGGASSAGSTPTSPNTEPVSVGNVTMADLPSSITFSGEDMTYGTYLNPQDPSGTEKTMPLTKLFSPLKIGGVTLKNRVVKSAAGSEMQNNGEWPCREALEFYGEFARGGVGMICYEGSINIPMPGAPGDGLLVSAPEGMGVLDISNDAGIPAHKAIADYLHGEGTCVIAQLGDGIMATGCSSTKVHVFDLEQSPAPGRMQATEDVQKEIQQFADAAERFYKAGFDGVEINCSCNHYFST